LEAERVSLSYDEEAGGGVQGLGFRGLVVRFRCAYPFLPCFPSNRVDWIVFFRSQEALSSLDESIRSQAFTLLSVRHYPPPGILNRPPLPRAYRADLETSALSGGLPKRCSLSHLYSTHFDRRCGGRLRPQASGRNSSAKRCEPSALGPTLGRASSSTLLDAAYTLAHRIRTPA
jgi:hypothetical protein